MKLLVDIGISCQNHVVFVLATSTGREMCCREKSLKVKNKLLLMCFIDCFGRRQFTSTVLRHNQQNYSKVV